MRLRYYIAVVLLILLAIAASLYLIPRPQEVALMQMKDNYFEQARASYEQAIASGQLTLENASKLAQLYEQNGELDKAIEIIERFLKAQPDNLEARQYVGTLYQYAQRPDDYLRNLEEINRLKPSPENLKTLSDIYNFNSEYERQAGDAEAIDRPGKRRKPQALCRSGDYSGGTATLCGSHWRVAGAA